MQISEFRIAILDSAVADLNARLERTRWPDQAADAGWDAGTELFYLKDLADYWLHDFDWRVQESRSIGFPNSRLR